MVNTVGINLGWFTGMSICSMRYRVNTVGINLGWLTRMSICSMRYMVNTVSINLGWFTRMSICSMRYMVNTVGINLGWFTRMSICSMRYLHGGRVDLREEAHGEDDGEAENQPVHRIPTRENNINYSSVAEPKLFIFGSGSFRLHLCP